VAPISLPASAVPRTRAWILAKPDDSKDAVPHFSAVDVNRARASVQNRVRAFVQAASDLGFMLA
jgi:hypothetical protein